MALKNKCSTVQGQDIDGRGSEYANGIMAQDQGCVYDGACFNENTDPACEL